MEWDEMRPRERDEKWKVEIYDGDKLVHTSPDMERRDSSVLPQLGCTVREATEGATRLGKAMKEAMPSAKDYADAWENGFNPTPKEDKT